MVTYTMKQCPHCHEYKDEKDFRFDAKKNKLESWCIECQRRASREYQQKHKELYNKRSAQYHKDDPEYKKKVSEYASSDRRKKFMRKFYVSKNGRLLALKKRRAKAKSLDTIYKIDEEIERLKRLPKHSKK